MAHFAQLDENNKVISVIVVSEEDAKTEKEGIEFCKKLLGKETNWLQCSYNGNTRGCYPGYGFEYNKVLDIFIPPKPFPSWVLKDGKWIAPKNMPKKTDTPYIWDEDKLKWIKI